MLSTPSGLPPLRRHVSSRPPIYAARTCAAVPPAGAPAPSPTPRERRLEAKRRKAKSPPNEARPASPSRDTRPKQQAGRTSKQSEAPAASPRTEERSAQPQKSGASKAAPKLPAAAADRPQAPKAKSKPRTPRQPTGASAKRSQSTQPTPQTPLPGLKPWPVFTQPPPPTTHSVRSQSYTHGHGPVAGHDVAATLAARRAPLQAVSGAELESVALAWADEISASAVGYHQQHYAAHSHEGSTGAAAAAAEVLVGQCASAPGEWWAQLPIAQQVAALANVCGLACEALHRLGGSTDDAVQTSTAHAASISTPPPIAAQTAGQKGAVAAAAAAATAGGAAAAAAAPVLAAGPSAAAAAAPSHILSTLCGGAGGGMDGSQSEDETGGVRVTYVPDVGSPQHTRDAVGLTRQQHASIAWAVSHLWCAHGSGTQQAMTPTHTDSQPTTHAASSPSPPAPTPTTQHTAAQRTHPDTHSTTEPHTLSTDTNSTTPVMHGGSHSTVQSHTEGNQQLVALRDALVRLHGVLMRRLHAALNVPFCVVPMALPGLSVGWFEGEVGLRRDTIWLDNGTRAVEESRLTGWQSDIGVTFKYSGKEMQPEEGGLSPCVTKVRDVLRCMTGQHYDSVLINLYPDGSCGMRYHADPLYGCWTPETSVVSVGHTRRFVFREAKDFSVRWSYTVRNGDVAVMFGDCQDRLQHSVLTEDKETRVGPRVSLVYKQRIPGTV